jgi:plastocyanin
MMPHHPPRWRRLLVAAWLSSLAAFASAATPTTAPASASSTAPEGVQTHTILVGSGGDFAYHPNSINASVGDVVTFEFYPTNHSVIRGEYTGSQACGSGGCNPCVPVELIDPAVPPFASKNFLTQDLPSAANMEIQSYNLTVNDTNPIWFYCDAISSCLNGMVGVINPV